MKLFYSESLLDDDSLASDPVSLSDDAMMPYTMPFLASLVAHAAVALLRFSSVAAADDADDRRRPGSESRRRPLL